MLTFEVAHDEALVFDQLIWFPCPISFRETHAATKTIFICRSAWYFTRDEKHVVQHRMDRIALLKGGPCLRYLLEGRIGFKGDRIHPFRFHPPKVWTIRMRIDYDSRLDGRPGIVDEANGLQQASAVVTMEM